MTLCKKCVDNHGDSRFNAFQPFFMVTWLSQKQAIQAQKDMQNGVSKPVLHLEQDVVATEDEARDRMYAMEHDPAVARFNLEKVVVTLN